MPEIALCCFDKDGTLLDFEATWLPALRASAARVATGAIASPSAAADLTQALCRTGGLTDEALDPAGQFAQGTALELAQLWIERHPPVAALWKSDAAALAEQIQATWLEATVRDATPDRKSVV